MDFDVTGTLHRKSPGENKKFLFWKDELESMGTDQILRLAVEKCYPRVAVMTCFEPEGWLLLNMLSKLVREITILCPDLDCFYPKVWRTSKLFHDRLGVQVNHTATPFHELSDRERSSKFDLLLYGFRRENKPDMAILDWHEEYEIPYLAPLARWTTRAVWEKLRTDHIARGIPWLNLHWK